MFSSCTYIKPLSAIIDSHSIIHHSFADDIQLQMSAPPDRISELLHSMQSCIGDVKAWATANMLKFNDSKTELMLVTSKRSKHLHNLPTSITILYHYHYILYTIYYIYYILSLYYR